MQNIDNRCFLKFLRYCLSYEKQHIPSCISCINWDALLNFAEKQSILGIYANVLFKNNNQLTESEWMGNKPSELCLMKWYGYFNIIERRNQQVNKKTIEVVKQYQKGGFDTYILKGQGNAAYYPNPMSRNSGDIDIWVIPKR